MIARHLYAGVLAVALMAAAMPVFAQAQDSAEKSVSVELNNARPQGDGCRLSFVFQNSLEQTIEGLSLEVVLFDGEGLVDRFLVLKTGLLPAGKARVRQFDVAEHDCGSISRILVNGVTDCAGEGLTPRTCLEALAVSSRTDTELEY